MTGSDARLPADEVRPPLQPGQAAPPFVLLRADEDGTIALDGYRGRPVLLTLMRGLQCPFCRRNLALLGRRAPALRQLGVETLAIIGTTAARARIYFRYHPIGYPIAADPELDTHRRYGIPCYPMTPALLDQLRTTRVDPFRELPAAIPFIGPDGAEIHDVYDRLDGFVPNDVDQRDRTRQFRESVQLCGLYMLDAAGIVRWAHVEGEPGGLAKAGIFPSEDTLVAVARNVRATSTHETSEAVEGSMATAKQKAAARRNIKKAARAARRKRTIARLPKKTRTALGKEGAKAARRKRRRGRA